ncbi:MAG: LTA synthase family protein [Candidatus Binatia bacterium]
MSNLLYAMPRTVFSISVVLTAMAILSGFRLWLYYERASDLTDLSLVERLRLFWIGFRLDGTVVGKGFLILIVALLFSVEEWLEIVQSALLVYAGILFFGLFLAEIAGVYFFRYYDLRPNYLVLEHGLDLEVLRTIAKAYPIAWMLFLSAAGTAGVVSLVAEIKGLSLEGTESFYGPFPWFLDQLGTVFCCLLAALAARGTLDHRPLNPSAAMVTSNRVANEIASCGIFNVLYEWSRRSRRDQTDLKSVIRLLPSNEALRRAGTYLSIRGPLTHDSPNPLVRRVRGYGGHHPVNVVLVVMESFTSRLIGALGGTPALSPELDRLSAEGALLECCYATGERTIQALEAAVSSFPPLPGHGVVNRPQAHRGFSTLATILKERDYSTLFLYGGQGIFDRMRAFFLGNGFDTFIEEKDFDNVEYRSPWGVSDEDLFRRANQEFRQLANQRQPFFATILTVSLHSPWEYPAGRIVPLPLETPVPPGFKYEELNNFLYADYALGRFMREAKGASYFEDTLFVFVGDHGVHLRGRDLIPVEEYRVPALFFAPRFLKPKRIQRVTSQIDLPPTIMGILGGEYRSPFLGNDVLSPGAQESLAIMIYNKKRYGVIFGPHLTVFTETGMETAYKRIQGEPSWNPAPLTSEQANYSRDAVALLQMAEHLLKTGQYTTGKEGNSSSRSSAVK